MQHLPFELLCLICDELSDAPTALSRLGRSARVFVAPAQELLFRSVDLDGSSMRVVRSWCTAVTRKRKDAAPLALLVRSLVLELPETVQFAPDDMAKVAAALKLCINLKTLRLLRAPGDLDFPDITEPCVWILEECTFQLIGFQNAYFDAPDLRRFVEAQTHLRIFHGANGGAALPKDLIGHGSGSYFSIEHRPLQRIEIVRRSPDYIASLRCCAAQSLTTLNIVGEYDSGTSPYASLMAVAENFPHLIHLAIVQGARERWRRRREPAPQQAIHGFHQLETFTYFPRNTSLFRVADDAQTHREYTPEDEDDMRAMTRATIEACPTLYRVVVGIEDENEVQSAYTATRDGLGQVRVRSARGAINFNALSMFWAPV